MSTGHILTIVGMVVAGAIAWGASQSDIRAIAHRIDRAERTDERTAADISDIKGDVRELKVLVRRLLREPTP